MAVRLVVRSPTTSPTSPGVTYEFDQQRIVIGRGTGADVRIPDRVVSESHAIIRLERAGYMLLDEGSTNGTSVSGTRLVVGRVKPLRTGDTIEIGPYVIAFTAGIPTAATASAERTKELARRLIRELIDLDSAATPQPRIVVTEGPQQGTSLDLGAPPSRALIGRGDDNQLVLADADVSRVHAELVRDEEGVLLRDIGSKNGLVVNDRVVRERRLRDRDELVLGATRLVFEDPAESRVRETEGGPDEKAQAAPAAAPAPPPMVGLEDPALLPRQSAPPTPVATPGPNDTDDEVASEPAGRAPSAVTATRTRAKRDGLSADVFIYVLALVVLAASAAALVALLRSS